MAVLLEELGSSLCRLVVAVCISHWRDCDRGPELLARDVRDLETGTLMAVAGCAAGMRGAKRSLTVPVLNVPNGGALGRLPPDIRKYKGLVRGAMGFMLMIFRVKVHISP